MADERLKDSFVEYFENEAQIIVETQISVETGEINKEKLKEIAKSILPIEKSDEKLLETGDKEELIENLRKIFKKGYESKEKEIGEKLTGVLEHALFFHTIDRLWVDHLDAMDHLREGIGLRGYGQKDPLIEYKNESYQMFQTLLAAILSEVVNTFFKVSVQENPAPVQEEPERKTKTEVVEKDKIGRNDPCPCGSGKKYKKCHGR